MDIQFGNHDNTGLHHRNFISSFAREAGSPMKLTSGDGSAPAKCFNLPNLLVVHKIGIKETFTVKHISGGIPSTSEYSPKRYLMVYVTSVYNYKACFWHTQKKT